MKKEAIDVIEAWDKLKGGRHHSIATMQDWIINDLTPAISQLKRKVGYDYNKKCSRPDGCYSDIGKPLCNFGCDCDCHNGEE